MCSDLSVIHSTNVKASIRGENILARYPIQSLRTTQYFSDLFLRANPGNSCRELFNPYRDDPKSIRSAILGLPLSCLTSPAEFPPLVPDRITSSMRALCGGPNCATMFLKAPWSNAASSRSRADVSRKTRGSLLEEARERSAGRMKEKYNGTFCSERVRCELGGPERPLERSTYLVGALGPK
jgi:hypothetical protein